MTTQYKIGMHMYLLAIAELAIYSFVKGDFAMTHPRPLPEVLLGINPSHPSEIACIWFFHLGHISLVEIVQRDLQIELILLLEIFS